jgi:hypothetical protein
VFLFALNVGVIALLLVILHVIPSALTNEVANLILESCVIVGVVAPSRERGGRKEKEGINSKSIKEACRQRLPEA